MACQEMESVQAGGGGSTAQSREHRAKVHFGADLWLESPLGANSS